MSFFYLGLIWPRAVGQGGVGAKGPVRKRVKSSVLWKYNNSHYSERFLSQLPFRVVRVYFTAISVCFHPGQAKIVLGPTPLDCSPTPYKGVLYRATSAVHRTKGRSQILFTVMLFGPTPPPPHHKCFYRLIHQGSGGGPKNCTYKVKIGPYYSLLLFHDLHTASLMQ
jgi:hypothetical protein